MQISSASSLSREERLSADGLFQETVVETGEEAISGGFPFF